MTHIIALTGYAGSGKDTVADMLVQHAGFYKLAFADALRGQACAAFDVDEHTFTQRTLKETPIRALALERGPEEFVNAVLRANAVGHPLTAEAMSAPRSPRQILQWWGTEYRRSQHPDYWTRQVMRKIAYREKEYGERRFVLTDCRFSNEAAMVRRLHGLIWQVRRPAVDAASTAEGVHASATDGTAFTPDHVVHNDVELSALRYSVLGAWWALESGLDNFDVLPRTGVAA